MKINHSLPQFGDMFNHDAPLYKIIKIAVPTFILISSITVFSGVKLHISEYLENYSWWVTVPGYGFAYLLFSLSPDVLNSILIAYVVRSILHRNFLRTDLILNAFALILIIFLTRYSFNMSQFSAGSVGDEVGQEIQDIDLSEINSAYSLERKEIQSIYQEDKKAAERLFNEQKTAIESETAALLNPLSEKIKSFEKNRTKKNTQWTDKKIRQANDQITIIQLDQGEKLQKALKEKNDKLTQLQTRRDAETKALNTDKATDRNLTKSLKGKRNEEIEKANAFLTSELEKIAGFAIFIVLILASLKEIIHFRNKIDPQPILSKMDFQFSWLQEILLYPFEYLKRHATNLIRNKYRSLPELVEPIEVPKLERYFVHQIINEELPPPPENVEADYTFFRAGKTSKTGEPFIAHEKHTKTTGKKVESSTPKTHQETPEMRQARQRLKQYKKNLGKHQQKARTQKKKTGFITSRTKKAIENNQSWIDHYTDILNGGNGTKN